MTKRRVVQVLALFGLYAIIGTRIIGFSQSSSPSPTMLVELSIVSALFVIGAIFIFTRPVRAPLD
jgi:hypothetical protein